MAYLYIPIVTTRDTHQVSDNTVLRGAAERATLGLAPYLTREQTLPL